MTTTSIPPTAITDTLAEALPSPGWAVRRELDEFDDGTGHIWVIDYGEKSRDLADFYTRVEQYTHWAPDTAAKPYPVTVLVEWRDENGEDNEFDVHLSDIPSLIRALGDALASAGGVR